MGVQGQPDDGEINRGEAKSRRKDAKVTQRSTKKMVERCVTLASLWLLFASFYLSLFVCFSTASNVRAVSSIKGLFPSATASRYCRAASQRTFN